MAVRFDTKAADDLLAWPPALPPNAGQRRATRQELAAANRLAYELSVVAAGLELHQRLVVAGHDDHRHLGLSRTALHHEMQSVETTKMHVGHKQVVVLGAHQALGRLVF